jgi:hypothetical protein
MVKQAQDDTAIGHIRRKRREWEKTEIETERLIADATERVRAAVSPLDMKARRRVLACCAVLFGDEDLARAILGEEHGVRL